MARTHRDLPMPSATRLDMALEDLDDKLKYVEFLERRVDMLERGLNMLQRNMEMMMHMASGHALPHHQVAALSPEHPTPTGASDEEQQDQDHGDRKDLRGSHLIGGLPGKAMPPPTRAELQRLRMRAAML